MDDDDDLWGPPFVVLDDSFCKQTLLRGCEFWFDFRTDVLEENYQNERYCELVLRILNEKKQLVEISDEVDKDWKDMASSGSGDSHDVGASDSDKTVSAIVLDADTSSSESALNEDENTSSISDAQTIETVDSCNDTRDVDTETRLKPQETVANDSITVEVPEEADTSSSPVLANKIEEAEEHSCSSLVTDQVFDPLKQVPENKSSSAISRENIGGSALSPLVLETIEKVKEKANVTNEDGETLKDDQQQSDNSLQDVVTVSEPFTTESLLEMCDEPDKGREAPSDERNKRSHPDAVKAFVKDELIINMLNDARKKTEKKALLKPGSVLTKKRAGKSNISMDTSFIRTTKQKVGGAAGEINIDPVKKSTSKIIRGGSSVPTQLTDSIDRISQSGGQTMSNSVISISDLKNKTGKELRGIAKDLKVLHYYKMKKEDLLQHTIMKLQSQLTECTKQRMESEEPISLV